MSIYPHQSVEKNFDSILEDLNKTKDLTLVKIKELENANDIKEIQRLEGLHLESVKLQPYTSHNSYDNSIKVRMDLSKDTVKLIKDKPELLSGIGLSQYDFYQVRISEQSELEDKENFKTFIDALIEIDKPTHLLNIESNKNNAKTASSIFKLLDRIGIRTKYSGFSSKRSTKRTEQYYNFPSEIRNQIPTHYSEKKLEELKAAKIKEFSEIYDRELKKIKDVRKQKEKEESERLSNKKLALLLAKHDLNLLCDWDDILRAIIDKNKYLRLAYYLECNRNDWNDGCRSAQTGLNGFNIETELDQEIYDNIYQYMGENWDGDGRVFRDCEYNYSALYAMVQEQDKGLCDDYREAKENIKEY